MGKINQYYYNKNAPLSSMVEAIKPFEGKIKNLEKLAKGLAEDHQITLDLTKLREFKSHHTNLLRKLGEKYIEDVIYYPKIIPYGRNVKPGDIGATHFETFKGVSFDNQVYFVRYGRRAVDGGRGKAYVVHEGQADVHQAAFKAMKEGGARVNPFNTEQEYAQANHAMTKLLGQMKIISDKGVVSTGDRAQYWKLSQQFDEIRKNTLNASKNLRELGETGKDVPFLPFLERDLWGDHLVKHMAKTAADDGIQWIAINPVERLHVLKRAEGSGNTVGKLGDWEFYGTASGKAGMRGVKAHSDVQSKEILTNPKLTAVLPERMKKLALQYDSIAQTIKVAKSDPNKPFKILHKFTFEPRSPARVLGYTKAPSEHEMAFKTLKEAQEYLGTRTVGRSRSNIIELAPDDPRLYYEAFGLKITPQMLEQPFKLYKKEGGLVVNIFKW